MAQLLVRDLDEDLVTLLKRRAERNGRSAEAEHRAILESALRSSKAAFLEQVARFQAEMQGRVTSDSTEIIREYRDRDGSLP